MENRCKCGSTDFEYVEVLENDKDIPTGDYRLCHGCKGSWKVHECEVYSRVVGYLRPVSQWNKGKKEEYEKRTTYKMEEKK